MTDPFLFFQRPFPSANTILVKDERSTLIDTGFVSDYNDLELWLTRNGVPPSELHLIINTHYHSDHVGGNARLQQEYSLPIAAHRWEGELVNACSPEAGCAEWLDQPIPSYRVDRMLADRDTICTGTHTLEVIHTPGHSLGHISLYEPETQVLICGDVFDQYDVGWLNVFREGTASLYRAIESLERLASFRIARLYPGHGPIVTDVQAAVDKARRRFDSWRTQPEKMAWHGCKRVFAYALMIYGGISDEKVKEYLYTRPWFIDYSRYAFQMQPDEFANVLLAERIRSGAAVLHQGIWKANTPYNEPTPEEREKYTWPADWKGSAHV